MGWVSSFRRLAWRNHSGDAADIETRLTIDRAESRKQAMALLLMSPEFQRR